MTEVTSIFNLNGRMKRSEYAGIILISWILVATVIAIIVVATVLAKYSDIVWKVPMFGLLIIYTIIQFCVTVKRLHDLNKPWPWALISLITFIGQWMVLILMFIPGTKGDNRFGPEPDND